MLQPNFAFKWIRVHLHIKNAFIKLIHFEIRIEQMLKVLYDFDAEAGTELTVKEGDVLTILSKDAGDGWWNARLVFTFIRVNTIGR